MPAGKAGGSIAVVAGSDLVDGETITIGEGVTSKTFEFDNNSTIAPGNVAVAFTGASTAIEVCDALLAAINAEPNLNITASSPAPIKSALTLTNDHYGKHGNVPIKETRSSRIPS